MPKRLRPLPESEGEIVAEGIVQMNIKPTWRNINAVNAHEYI
jgi:hypothetical protein